MFKTISTIGAAVFVGANLYTARGFTTDQIKKVKPHEALSTIPTDLGKGPSCPVIDKSNFVCDCYEMVLPISIPRELLGGSFKQKGASEKEYSGSISLSAQQTNFQNAVLEDYCSCFSESSLWKWEAWLVGLVFSPPSHLQTDAMVDEKSKSASTRFAVGYSQGPWIVEARTYPCPHSAPPSKGDKGIDESSSSSSGVLLRWGPMTKHTDTSGRTYLGAEVCFEDHNLEAKWGSHRKDKSGSCVTVPVKFHFGSAIWPARKQQPATPSNSKQGLLSSFGSFLFRNSLVFHEYYSRFLLAQSVNEYKRRQKWGYA